MASQSEFDPAELRKRVTSPNGTTERAINSFNADQLPEIFEKAMTACRDRSAELAEQLSQR